MGALAKRNNYNMNGGVPYAKKIGWRRHIQKLRHRQRANALYTKKYKDNSDGMQRRDMVPSTGAREVWSKKPRLGSTHLCMCIYSCTVLCCSWGMLSFSYFISALYVFGLFLYFLELSTRGDTGYHIPHLKCDRAPTPILIFFLRIKWW